MSKSYKYCNVYTAHTVTVNMSATTCTYNSQVFQGGNTYTYHKKNLVFDLSASASVPLTVNYKYHYTEYRNSVLYYDYSANTSTIIPAGVTHYVKQVDCLTYEYVSTGYDQVHHEVIYENRTKTWDNYTLLNQVTIPTCAAPPPSCFLTITASTVTDTSVRGASDGSIQIFLSGATGVTSNMTYIINGVVKTNTGSRNGYTFTGLAAGYYDIYLYQADGYCSLGLYDVLVIDGDFRTGNFIISNPANLVAVENPVIFNVGTALNDPTPSKDSIYFSFDHDVADGYHITFNMTSPFVYTQTFYAKGYPSKPNYFLASLLLDEDGTPAGTNSHIEIATSFAEVLNADAVISKVYDIIPIDYIIEINAKETGSKYNLTTSNVVQYNPNNTVNTTGVTFHVLTTGTDYCDGQLTDNYSISCEVYTNNDLTIQYPEEGDVADYTKGAELVLPFNPTNVHKFDVSGILKPKVYTPKPNSDLTGSTLLPTAMQPYYVKFYENYPLIPNTQTIKKRYKSTSTKRWYLNSSLDRTTANDMGDWLGDQLSNLNPNFTLTQSWLNNSTPTGLTTISNYLIDPLDLTGTTNIKFSVWNSNNSAIVYNWQSGTSFHIATQVSLNFHVSGLTNGYYHSEYYKWFFNNPYARNYDQTVKTYKKDDVLFLTSSPNPKQIQRNSEEFLYYVMPKDYGTTMKLKGNLYFYDGSSVTGWTTTFFTISTGSTNAGGVLCLNLSYDKLGLVNWEVSGSTNRKIKRVEVAVYQYDTINGDVPFTETKTYRFEIDEQPRKFGIIFQSNLGMFDSYDMVGIVEETVSRTTDNYTVPLNYSNDGSLPEGYKSTATYNTKVVKRVVCNTGWIDAAHFNWLHEILESSNIYSTSTLKQNYLNLVEFTYKKSSLDDLYDAEFTFEQTLFENTVTI